MRRTDLERRALSADRIWYCGEDRTFTLSHDEPDMLPRSFEEQIGLRSARQPFVCECPDATLIGPFPLALNADGEVILELAENSQMYLFERHLRYQSSRRQSGRVGQYLQLLWDRIVNGGATTETLYSEFGPHDGTSRSTTTYETCFPLIHLYTNYFHWMIECLPKIRLLERYVAETGNEPVILLKEDPPSWMLESLDIVTQGAYEVDEWTDDQAQVDRLIVPFHRIHYIAPDEKPYRDAVRFAPGDYKWVRDRMLSETASSNVGPEKSVRIYISRRDADLRRVSNESTLMAKLAPLGFELYALSELSVREQVQLFARAELIVSPHGAGLTNLVFSTDATVIELLPSDYVHPYYFGLARSLGHEYDCKICPTQGDDLLVDPNELTKCIESHLRRESTP